MRHLLPLTDRHLPDIPTERYPIRDVRPVDMRRGFDGLPADVAQVLRADPDSGAVLAFRSRRGDYLKIVTWDGSGLRRFAKRLEKGRSVWPPIVTAACA